MSLALVDTRSKFYFIHSSSPELRKLKHRIPSMGATTREYIRRPWARKLGIKSDSQSLTVICPSLLSFCVSSHLWFNFDMYKFFFSCFFYLSSSNEYFYYFSAFLFFVFFLVSFSIFLFLCFILFWCLLLVFVMLYFFFGRVFYFLLFFA